MSKRKIIFSAMLLSLLVSLAVTKTAAYVYEVVLDDTLSTIALKKMSDKSQPLYGKNGRLDRLVKANPHVKNPNYIYPGTEIEIPEERDAEFVSAPAPESEQNLDISEQGKKADDLKSSEVNSDSRKQWAMQGAVGISYFRIDAKDTLYFGSAQLLSDTGVFFAGEVTQAWSESFYTFQDINVVSYRFINVKTGQQLKDPGLVSSINFGVKSKRTPDWSLAASLGLRQTLFVKTADAVNYEFERLPVPVVRLISQHAVYHKEKLQLELNPFLEYLAPASSDTISSKSGWGAGLEIATAYRKEDIQYKTFAMYRQAYHKSNIVDEKQAELTFGIAYQSWSF